MKKQIIDVIKDLWTKPGVKIALAIETLILLCLVVNLFFHNDVFTYEFQGEDIINNVYLPAGTYTATIRYSSDTNYGAEIKCYDEQNSSYTLRSSEIWLFTGVEEDSFEVFVQGKTDTATVEMISFDDANVELQSITFNENAAGARILLFMYLMLIVIVDGVLVSVCYDKLYGIKKDTKVVFGVLIGLSIILCIPLMMDYYLNGADLGYHLLRVEGIRDSILGGEFPNRIAPGWLQEHGYASAIYYCETLLYIEAFFRLIGFDVVTAYRLFMVVITLLTVGIAYFSYTYAFRNKIAGLVSTVIYCLSFYRFCKTYASGAFGECFAVMILPLFFYSFYRLYTDDVNEKSYKYRYIPLAISYSVLLQSHLLSTEQMGVATVILGIILFKRTFRLRTILEYVKGAILSALLSLWYLIPFVEYWIKEDVVIQNVSARTIQDMGLFAAHHFVGFAGSGDNTVYYETGMYNSSTVGLGLIVPVVFIIFAVIIYNKKELLSKLDRGAAYVCAAFSIVTMIISLNVFPWDKIQFMSGITEMLVSSIQFPNRFLTITNVCIAALAGFVVKAIISQKKSPRRFVIFGLIGVSLISHLYYMNIYLEAADFTRIYNPEAMGSGYVSGGEYLPYGVHEDIYRHLPQATDGISVDNVNRSSFGTTMYVDNQSESSGYVTVDFLYYHNYRAFCGDLELICEPDDVGEVKITIPKGLKGDISVRYTIPVYWRISEIISGLALVALIILGVAAARVSERLVKEDNFTELFDDIRNPIELKYTYSMGVQIALVLAVYIISVLPVFYEFVSSGDDILNSIAKITTLSESVMIRRLAPAATDDFGSYFNIIQSNICYYLPALLYRAGIPFVVAYKLWLGIINLLTAFMALFVFGKIAKVLGMNGKKSTVNPIVIIYAFYMLNPGRLTDLYIAGNLGRGLVYAVLPIVALGVVNILKGKRGGILLAALGLSFTGLCSVQIQTQMILAFVVFMLLAEIRKNFFGKVLKIIAVCILSYLANAFVYVQVLVACKDAEYVVRSVATNVQGMGVYISQYLLMFFGDGISEKYFENGLDYAKALGPGLGLILVLLICLIYGKVKGIKLNSYKYTFIFTTIILMLLSLNGCPYFLLQNKKYGLSVLLSLWGRPAELSVAISLILTVGLLVVMTAYYAKNTYIFRIFTCISLLFSIGPAITFDWLLYKSNAAIGGDVVNSLAENSARFEIMPESKLFLAADAISALVFVGLIFAIIAICSVGGKKGKVDGK